MWVWVSVRWWMTLMVCIWYIIYIYIYIYVVMYTYIIYIYIYIYIYMFEASAYEAHASAYFSRCPFFCPPNHKWPIGGNAGESSSMWGELGSPGESSPKWRIGCSRLVQQRVRQCLLCALETESQPYALNGTTQACYVSETESQRAQWHCARDEGLLQSAEDRRHTK